MWLGVTVAIPEPYRSALAKARANSGDPLAGTIPPHVTLVPPTEVDGELLPDVQLALERVAARYPAFTMSLTGTGTFRPVSPVVYVALQRGWDDCVALQEQINDGVLAQVLQFPYHPHVTIAHHLEDAQLDRAQEEMKGFRGEFTVSAIDLFEHEGEMWRKVQSFHLQG